MVVVVATSPSERSLGKRYVQALVSCWDMILQEMMHTVKAKEGWGVHLSLRDKVVEGCLRSQRRCGVASLKLGKRKFVLCRDTAGEVVVMKFKTAKSP